jgi:hypothetical protein
LQLGPPRAAWRQIPGRQGSGGAAGLLSCRAGGPRAANEASSTIDHESGVVTVTGCGYNGSLHPSLVEVAEELPE